MENFYVLIGKPGTILSQKTAVLRDIETLFYEGYNLLKLIRDNSIMIFIELQSGFYNGYDKARVIVGN